MKKYFAILMAALLALPLSAQNTPEKEPEKLVVMSYNIRVVTAKDTADTHWNVRKVATPAMLDDINPAVFGLQEATQKQITYITANCPRYVTFGVGREDGASKGEHMSIVYNHEVLEMLNGGTYWLSDTPDEPSFGWDAACKRTATWALFRVKKSGKHFYYVNTHLDHKGAEARRNGLALIVERIAKMNTKGFPMVLTGDFNVTPDDPCLTDLDTKMLSARATATSSDRTHSYNGYGEPKSDIDYIYYSGFSACPEFKVVTKSYVGIPYISDHYPVTATLVF